MFIEEFFYGNIEAQSCTPEFAEELKKKLNELTEIEKQLSDKLAGDEKALFLKYTDKYIEFTAKSIADSFINGFRLGAKFTLDTFK
ncbi:MAG: hypothetical protein J6J45_06310 [Clostridia bacterium]|nr:hypothetical protein [Clostridia bacterium]